MAGDDGERGLDPQEQLMVARLRARRASRVLRTGEPGRARSGGRSGLAGLVVGAGIALLVAVVVVLVVLLAAHRDELARRRTDGAAPPGAAVSLAGPGRS